MTDTIAERLARIEERTVTILAKVEHGDSRLDEKFTALASKVDRQGTRFGARLDRVEAEVETVADQQNAWRNRAIGLIIGASATTGGVTAILLRLVSGVI